jgi:hypothetical protein
LLTTPIRRLEGITYWVIEDAAGIHDFINTEIRREWAADARFEQRGPSDDALLRTLSNRTWQLQIIALDRIALNPRIIQLADPDRGYRFTDELVERSAELQMAIRDYGAVIWPVIVRADDFQLMDGYCRHSALQQMKIRRVYAYIGQLSPQARTC